MPFRWPWQQRITASDEPALSPDDLQRIVEQINPTAIASSPTQEDWYWGRLATGGEEDYYWRRLSDNWYQKDVIPSTFLEILNACYEAYNSNPLAFAIIEMTTNFVLGKGIKVVAASKKVQKLIDAFWDDADNHMDLRLYDISNELSMYGEQFIRVFVNKYNGEVKIRQVDPALIDQIETDPEDIEHELRYHRRPIGPSATLPGDPVSVTPKDDSQWHGEWFTPDELYHFKINSVSNAKRGHSDLATLLPWLRRYKDWLTDRVRINKYKGAFLWDVTLTNADAKTIKSKKMEYSYPPEPGTVIIHNEAEKWTAVQPAINANDAKEDGRAIKLMVAVGAGIPEHWLSDGAEGNQATATQMGLPTFLKMQRRQKVMRALLNKILDTVIIEAKKAGSLPRTVDESYDLIFPEMDVEDNAITGNAMYLAVQALQIAKANGWISDETAINLISKFADEEFDAKEELDALARQAEQLLAGQPRSSKADGGTAGKSGQITATTMQQTGIEPGGTKLPERSRNPDQPY